MFQHGFGAGLLGIEHQGFVDAWAPLFFFALLFGLSMDYQLFLLAAIKERYEATGDTRRAIREGIARTGRPITNAALIMIVVFIAFGVTGPIPPTELGVTLAMAVLLDATVVRMMLVPATMALLGERNWYAPKWLRRSSPTCTSATDTHDAARATHDAGLRRRAPTDRDPSTIVGRRRGLGRLAATSAWGRNGMTSRSGGATPPDDPRMALS